MLSLVTNRHDSTAGEFAPLSELAEAFGTLVDALTDGRPACLTSEQIVRAAARCTPAAEHTGLLVWNGDHLHTVAATSPLFERLEQIRGETGQGPGLDVIEVNDVVTTGDLGEDLRWPDFGARALDELNLRSVSAYRLYLGPSRRAALMFVSSWPYAFDEAALATGAIFAAYCSLTLFTEIVLSDRLTGRRAAEVHREIGVAIGILMASGELDVDAAYGRLHAASRGLRQSLHGTARDVIAAQAPGHRPGVARGR
jgi:hypothetical protein